MNLRHLLNLRIFLVFLSLAAFLFGTDSRAQFRYENVSLVRVVDGDTVRLQIEIEPGLVRASQSCRLLRVDAPELFQPGGKEAKAALENFLAGKKLAVQVKGRDAFGRFLVELWAGGENVSDWILSSRKPPA